LRHRIPFNVSRFKRKEFSGEIVLEDVAGSRAVQTAEPAQIVIELLSSCGRESVIDLICWTRHEGHYSWVLALAPGFPWESVEKGGLILEEIVVRTE
jgi:hypothetical protein